MSNLPTTALGAVAKARRLELGLSVKALSHRTGISEPTIWRTEQAKTTPSTHTLLALARGLDLPPAKLLEVT